MKVFARELLFQSLGHFQEFKDECKDKAKTKLVDKLKTKIARLLYPYRKNVHYDVQRSSLKLNSCGVKGATDSLPLALCCMFEALEFCTERDIPIKVQKILIDDGMKLYRNYEIEHKESCRVANSVCKNYSRY